MVGLFETFPIVYTHCTLLGKAGYAFIWYHHIVMATYKSIARSVNFLGLLLQLHSCWISVQKGIYGLQVWCEHTISDSIMRQSDFPTEAFAERYRCSFLHRVGYQPCSAFCELLYRQRPVHMFEETQWLIPVNSVEQFRVDLDFKLERLFGILFVPVLFMTPGAVCCVILQKSMAFLNRVLTERSTSISSTLWRLDISRSCNTLELVQRDSHELSTYSSDNFHSSLTLSPRLPLFRDRLSLM